MNILRLRIYYNTLYCLLNCSSIENLACIGLGKEKESCIAFTKPRCHSQPCPEG